MIDPPLWDLMLSAQENRTGNENSAVIYKITPGRVASWVDTVGPATTQDALDQLDELLSLVKLDWKALSAQTSLNFANEAEAREWLGQWWDMLVQALQ